MHAGVWDLEMLSFDSGGGFAVRALEIEAGEFADLLNGFQAAQEARGSHVIPSELCTPSHVQSSPSR